MILDAQSFKTVLTPEAAMGLVQKTLAQKGWKKFDIADIKLVYVPYWLFSFDVLASTGASPTGKTALNAFTGELNDFIPVLFDRPLKKTKETAEGVEAEIEPTSITQEEVKTAAATKVAAHVGLAKDNVSISGATKFYIPFYRIWVDVADDTFKVDVDAMLGYPAGLENLPEKAKSWEEASKETVQKLRTPAGWAELTSKTIGEVGGAAMGAKPSAGGISGQNWRYLLLGLVIVVLIYFIFIAPGGSGNVSCQLSEQNLGKAAWFGLGAKPVIPSQGENNTMLVRGNCYFKNSGNQELAMVLAQLRITANGIIFTNTSYAINLPPSQIATQKPFIISWNANEAAGPYAFSYERS